MIRYNTLGSVERYKKIGPRIDFFSLAHPEPVEWAPARRAKKEPPANNSPAFSRPIGLRPSTKLRVSGTWKNLNKLILVIAFLLIGPSSLAAGSSNKQDFSLLLVSSFFGGSYQGLTGLDRYVFNYAQFLKNRGSRVAVLVQEGIAIEKAFNKAGITCYSWPFQKNQQKCNGRSGSFQQFMQKIITENKVTHVHCNMQMELHRVHAATKKYNIPLFYTHHYQYHFPIEKYNFLYGACLVDKLLVESISTCSQQAGRGLKRGVQHVPVVFIPPFFDEKFFLQKTLGMPHVTDNAVPVITMVGNMYLDMNAKNYPLLIDAVDRLIHHYKQSCKVLIVGDGPTRSKVEALVRKKGLCEQIQFLGLREDIPAIFAASDLVVLTSTHEGFGMALAEANILGKPVIGPDGTGVEGVIEDGVNGLLFGNGDVDDFCKKCLVLLTNPAERLAMGVRAQQYAAEHFTNEHVFVQMQQLYGM